MLYNCRVPFWLLWGLALAHCLENYAAIQEGKKQSLSHNYTHNQGDVKGHLHYVDESQVAYPCGHNTVLYNVETREQMLIHGLHSVGAPSVATAGAAGMVRVAKGACVEKIKAPPITSSLPSPL